MDHEFYDQDKFPREDDFDSPSWEDTYSQEEEAPAQEDWGDWDDEFPWFSNQNETPPPPPPTRQPVRNGSGGQRRPPQNRAGRPRQSRPPDRSPSARSDQRTRNAPPPRRRRRKKKPSVLRRLLLILLLIILGVGVGFGIYFHSILGKINFIDPSPTSQEDNIKKVDRITNLLLVGEDARWEGETGQRSDTMILCTLNPDTKEVILTSFMRDLYVPIPGYKSNRINTAFSRGGVELLEQTVEEDFGVHIDGYVGVDFGGFLEAIATLGDMEMELTEEEAEYMNAHPEYGWADWGTEWDLQPGWNTLDAWQFLCYARMRHLGNSDWDRTERQRKVLMTCYQQVKNCSVTQLLSLLNNVAPYITTDLRTTDLLSYAYMVTGEGVNNIESNRIPADGTYEMKNINGMDVIVPDLEQNKAILQEYVNNTRSNDVEAPAEGEGTADADHMGVVESPPVQGSYD